MTGMTEGFFLFGLKFSIPGFFWFGKFDKYFLGWLESRIWEGGGGGYSRCFNF